MPPSNVTLTCGVATAAVAPENTALVSLLDWKYWTSAPSVARRIGVKLSLGCPPLSVRTARVRGAAVLFATMRHDTCVIISVLVLATLRKTTTQEALTPQVVTVLDSA